MALEADAMEEKERAGWIQRSQMRKEKRERSEERVKAKIAEVRSIKAENSIDLKKLQYERGKFLAEKRVRAEVEKFRVDVHAKKETEIKRFFTQYTIRLRKRLLPIACRFSLDKGAMLHRYMALATCLASSRALDVSHFQSAVSCLQAAGIWCPRVQALMEMDSAERAERRRSSLQNPTAASAARSASAASIFEEYANRSPRESATSSGGTVEKQQQVVSGVRDLPQQPQPVQELQQRELVKKTERSRQSVLETFSNPPAPYTVHGQAQPRTRMTIGIPLPYMGTPSPPVWQQAPFDPYKPFPTEGFNFPVKTLQSAGRW
ncbi:hypothetical protein Pmar_PMAR000900 [Perkinsus marinus ATCC 50983]|uniref:Uncharacterized protein n=1 Tax=Perkinsus marinus (strain ATCC 50983 / TXsc) TaxID=423536 RepID=C5LK19_PERM5|nr:hypothetical protein Pmar_PMAR000900 [Perkinsus marinus ATCC 50983]EER02908.1 hypothetical protein Pmar_PMAR000900 [Perkinsus marinus ATCC 50983]|eukprot:XP_002771092.1 hypothetical protein Pmar_PMAR000900 [Perkinsus marinus ATCC 50983]